MSNLCVRTIVALVLHLLIGDCCAQTVNTPSPGPVPPTENISRSQDDQIRWELANAASKLISVEAAIGKASERADEVARRTSFYSLATVLVAALVAATVSVLTQMMLMRHQRKINLADSQAKVANSYVEWQLRQLAELYGPLRALLGQSNVMYRQMNLALIAADAGQFRLVPGNDFDRLEFQILVNQNWVRFRTVKHLARVYNQTYGVEPSFDDVVEVGGRLAELIRAKAGFVRQEDSDLVQVMGEYLAHYLVLKRQHDSAKAKQPLHPSAADEQAVFPSRIHELVNQGFTSINQQVMDWREISTKRK